MAIKKRTTKPAKATVKKRSLNAGATRATNKRNTGKPPGTTGEPFNNQDTQRRLGNFQTAGEHARVGGRTSGIVGQTTKRFRTEKRKKQS